MIAFENPGEIDVRSISTFGVSVKEGENPIGFFGTGLKYAIAVLLRTGHEVTIYSGESEIVFGVARETIREQNFDFVTMAIDGAAPAHIGFTTELGKQWELWMAYREIACNCKDEGGGGKYEHDMPERLPGVTKVIVNGDEFESVFAKGHFYILEDEPQMRVGGMEIRDRAGVDFYYRGVRVHQLQRPGIYTYNDIDKMELTEDRTVKNQAQPAYRIMCSVMKSKDARFLRTCITARDTTLEGGLDYHGWGIQPSDEFLKVVGDCVADRVLNVNMTAIKVWKDATKELATPREIELTSVQRKSLARALTFCGQIGFPIEGAYPIKVVESMGDGILGLAQDETIFIAERVFHLGGTKQLASTLIEEYLHLRHGWKDLTRELQSFLFDKLVSVGEELVGEPL